MPVTSEERYLDLLKQILTRSLFDGGLVAYEPPRDAPERPLWEALRDHSPPGVELVRRQPHDPEARAVGRDWPADAETMIGLRRLDNIQACLLAAAREGVPGDVLEAGVWRGGASILMRAVLAVYAITDRCVWVADSFEGLPPPDPARYPADAGDRHWTQAELVASLEDVRANFARYGLLDEQVRFLPGWFDETLASAPIDQLAVLRLDGDMYGSTIVALRSLYPKVAPGGFVIVDDYGAIEGCRQAVDDFCAEQGLTPELHRIDWTGVYWRKQGPGGASPAARDELQQRLDAVYDSATWKAGAALLWLPKKLRDAIGALMRAVPGSHPPGEHDPDGSGEDLRVQDR
ncbi:TylF/MycF/NovP-related O-methyltransferase [soil metagenome]